MTKNLLQIVPYISKHGKIILANQMNHVLMDQDAKFDGDVGNIYGVQWRNFNGEDQLTNLINGLKDDPNGRRHIISSWNPPELKNMSLPACHVLSQFFVSKNK